MDRISILGLLIGFIAIIGGQLLEGGHVGSLLDAMEQVLAEHFAIEMGT